MDENNNNSKTITIKLIEETLDPVDVIPEKLRLKICIQVGMIYSNKLASELNNTRHLKDKLLNFLESYNQKNLDGKLSVSTIISIYNWVWKKQRDGVNYVNPLSEDGFIYFTFEA